MTIDREFLVEWLRSIGPIRERGAAARSNTPSLLALIAVICIVSLSGFLGNQLSQQFDSTGVSIERQRTERSRPARRRATRRHGR